MTQYKVGKIVKGNITGIEKYGIFVGLDNFYSGLIHISEVSNDFVRNINDFGEVGETIYVKILEVDETTNHLKLSIKDIDYEYIENLYNTIYKEDYESYLDDDEFDKAHENTSIEDDMKELMELLNHKSH